MQNVLTDLSRSIINEQILIQQKINTTNNNSNIQYYSGLNQEKFDVLCIKQLFRKTIDFSPQLKEQFELEQEKFNTIQPKFLQNTFEYMESNDEEFYLISSPLFDSMNQQQLPIEERIAKGIFLQLIEAFYELHFMELNHYTICLENIGYQNSKIQLQRFGFESHYIFRNQYQNEEKFLSPQFKHCLYTNQIYSTQSQDMYNLGEIMQFILLGNPKNERIREKLSDSLIQLLESMANPIESERMKWENIIQHDYFKLGQNQPYEINRIQSTYSLEDMRNFYQRNNYQIESSYEIIGNKGSQQNLFKNQIQFQNQLFPCNEPIIGNIEQSEDVQVIDCQANKSEAEASFVNLANQIMDERFQQKPFQVSATNLEKKNDEISFKKGNQSIMQLNKQSSFEKISNPQFQQNAQVIQSNYNQQIQSNKGIQIQQSNYALINTLNNQNSKNQQQGQQNIHFSTGKIFFESPDLKQQHPRSQTDQYKNLLNNEYQSFNHMNNQQKVTEQFRFDFSQKPLKLNVIPDPQKNDMPLKTGQGNQVNNFDFSQKPLKLNVIPDPQKNDMPLKTGQGNQVNNFQMPQIVAGRQETQNIFNERFKQENPKKVENDQKVLNVQTDNNKNQSPNQLQIPENINASSKNKSKVNSILASNDNSIDISKSRQEYENNLKLVNELNQYFVSERNKYSLILNTCMLIYQQPESLFSKNDCFKYMINYSLLLVALRLNYDQIDQLGKLDFKQQEFTPKVLEFYKTTNQYKNVLQMLLDDAFTIETWFLASFYDLNDFKQLQEYSRLAISRFYMDSCDQLFKFISEESTKTLTQIFEAQQPKNQIGALLPKCKLSQRNLDKITTLRQSFTFKFSEDVVVQLLDTQILSIKAVLEKKKDNINLSHIEAYKILFFLLYIKKHYQNQFIPPKVKVVNLNNKDEFDCGRFFDKINSINNYIEIKSLVSEITK